MSRRPVPLRLPPLVLLAAVALAASALQVACAGPATPPRSSPPTASAATSPVLAERLAGDLVPRTDADAAARLAARKRQPTGDAVGRSREELYAAALVHRETMPRFRSARGEALPAGMPELEKAGALGTWEHLGPGNIGGRTRALLIDPRAPRTMYAAAISGGIFKTTDGGGRWRSVTDSLPLLTFGSLAFDPRNPDTIYAGTGEGVFREAVRGTALTLRGGGIFTSRDGGRSWRHLAATSGPAFHFVNAIAVSTGDPRRLYAATREGLYRSTNRGGAWQRVLDPKVLGGCFDVEIRPGQKRDDVLVACGTFERATVYRKLGAERGGGWEAVLSEAGMGRTSLAIAPSDPDVVYAMAASYLPGPGGNFEGGLHAVFRSAAFGAAGSWQARTRNSDETHLDTLLLSNPVIASLPDCQLGSKRSYSNLGWYANALAVDPLDPDVVYAGGVDLFRSDDGGSSWGLISYWWTGTSAHADQHTVVFDPRYGQGANRRMFVGGDGGVYVTSDPRATAARGPTASCEEANSGVTWRHLARDYGATQFYYGVAYDRGRRYLGGTQDNGTIFGSDALGDNRWREILGGDGGYPAVDPTDPEVVYASTQYLGLYKSTDAGVTFEWAADGIRHHLGDFLFITPMAMDPNDPRRLWVGGRHLWRTDDATASWTEASSLSPGAANVTAIDVAIGDSDRVVAGTTNGFVLRSTGATATNAATVWEHSRPRGGYVTSVALDPGDPQVVYATYAGFGGRHVYRSSDGGATWSAIDGSGAARLPDIPAHSLVVDPADSRRLYLGTDLGVFVSTDRGEHWAVEITGFAAALTESLDVIADGSRRWLFAFTHGRGAWRVALAGGGGGGNGGGGNGGGGDGGGGDGDACAWPPGHGHYCRDCGPCATGEGDCDQDADCAPGLACGADRGPDFGFGDAVDVCVAP